MLNEIYVLNATPLVIKMCVSNYVLIGALKPLKSLKRMFPERN